MAQHHKVRRVSDEAFLPDGVTASQYVFSSIAERIAPTTLLTEDEWRLNRNSLLEFTKYTFPGYKADRFHEDVCRHITGLVTGSEITNLMLFAPPQTGKSELVSTRLPSFWLAHNPELPVGLVSYGASLAFRNSRYARMVFESHQYNELFPEYEKDTQNWRTSDWHLRGHKGYILAAGVGGPITGHGFGLGIIDDPVENWAAAQSDTIRESIWQWWLGTFKTRMWEHGKIIFMMTRWHEDDLAGRILDQEGTIEEGGKWKVLAYPALCETENPEDDIVGREFGEAIAPSRYTAEYLRAFRATQSSHVWNAEYQQHPTAPEGDFFKIGRIDIVDAIPAEIGAVMKVSEHDFVPIKLKKGIRFWDMAASEKKQLKKDPDSTSGTLMAEHDDIFYILDNINEQLGPYEVQDIIKLTAKVDGKSVKVWMEQEPGSAGKSLIAFYIRELKGFIVGGRPATGSKMVRADSFASQVNAGNVKILTAPWNKRYLAQLASFPRGAHDDDIDSSSGAFNELTGGDTWDSVEFGSV